MQFFSIHNTNLVSLIQAHKCCHPHYIQRHRKDRSSLCGPSWYKAVHRPPERQRHIQHLSVLSGGTHEGECVFSSFNSWTSLFFCWTPQNRSELSLQRQIIYPRQQLMSLEELGTMNFMESDVTHLSLTLRNLAQWVFAFNATSTERSWMFTSVSFCTGGVKDSVEEPWGESHFWLMHSMERYSSLYNVMCFYHNWLVFLGSKHGKSLQCMTLSGLLLWCKDGNSIYY